jgi:tRNA modification GTPase
MRADETIFALSSAPGRAGVAVVRVSGPQAIASLQALSGRVPAPRKAELADIRHPTSSEKIDRGLVLLFPAPNSVTGEDVAEFHIHGGRASVSGVLEALGRVPGLRLAEPGEFTRRAFEAGKMDLAETEALADLIDAETAAQRRQALRGLEGGIGRMAEEWRGRLIEALALSEAEIDFPDEGDVPVGLIARAAEIAGALAKQIANVLGQDGGERLREGAVIVIAGPPNAGKSSFLNRVARRDVAIVSPYAGTTRDMLEVHLDLSGYPATLIDTAGVRATDDPVEQEALRRAEARAQHADLVLWFDDAAAPSEPPKDIAVPVWRVRNKIDLHDDTRQAPSLPGSTGPHPEPDRGAVRVEGWAADSEHVAIPRHALRAARDEVPLGMAVENAAPASFAVSALTGEGVDRLLKALGDWLTRELAPAESALITRERHRLALTEAQAHLARAASGIAPELMAEELRLSARALGRISWRVDVEDLLDAIFGSFCIGK